MFFISFGRRARKEMKKEREKLPKKALAGLDSAIRKAKKIHRDFDKTPLAKDWKEIFSLRQKCLKSLLEGYNNGSESAENVIYSTKAAIIGARRKYFSELVKYAKSKGADPLIVEMFEAERDRPFDIQ